MKEEFVGKTAYLLYLVPTDERYDEKLGKTIVKELGVITNRVKRDELGMDIIGSSSDEFVVYKPNEAISLGSSNILPVDDFNKEWFTDREKAFEEAIKRGL